MYLVEFILFDKPIFPSVTSDHSLTLLNYFKSLLRPWSQLHQGVTSRVSIRGTDCFGQWPLGWSSSWASLPVAAICIGLGSLAHDVPFKQLSHDRRNVLHTRTFIHNPTQESPTRQSSNNSALAAAKSKLSSLWLNAEIIKCTPTV